MSNPVDDSQVKALLADLEENQIRNILFGALKRGAYILKDNTLKNLRSRVSSNMTSKTFKRPIEEGVRMKGEKAYVEVNVNIMGDPRLLWLEKGTVIRKTDKGYNRGQITARNFFADARLDENSVYSAIEQQIEKSLSKIKK